MVNPAALGARGAPFSMDIERGKVMEFARAVHATHPGHYDDEPVIPPTFLTTMFHWEPTVEGSNPWPLVELDEHRGMQAEQEYTFHGPPPRAGTRLTCRSRIDSIIEKHGRQGPLTFITMVTEFCGDREQLVAEARMTAVETSSPPPPAENTSAAPPAGKRYGPVTRTDIVRYQGASGDMYPIHHDEPFALAAGHPAVLTVGMFHGGMLAAYASDGFGPTNLRYLRLRWAAPVWPGDTLTLTRKASGDAIELACFTQRGATAVTGVARFAKG